MCKIDDSKLKLTMLKIVLAVVPVERRIEFRILCFFCSKHTIHRVAMVIVVVDIMVQKRGLRVARGREGRLGVVYTMVVVIVAVRLSAEENV